jgi:teichuronic acid biosynthesis glycosyltransferase TuaC
VKVLFVSNLFPDATDPVRGLINATLLKQLARRVEVRALALRPTIAFLGRNFDNLKPRPEDEPLKPTYRTVTYIPKIGSRINHRLLAARAEATLHRIKYDFPYDVILSSWIYPDVCGIARLLKGLKVPMVAISQGSDVHQYLNIRFRRKLIVRTLSTIAATITRSKDLRDQLVSAGVPNTSIHPIYNGVNTGVFKPGDQLTARRALGLPEEGKIILYVGNFLPVKNPLLLVRTHGLLTKAMNPRPHLVMIGSGPQKEGLSIQANSQGTHGITHLVGRKNSAEVAQYMRAADLLCIPSDNEGVPNVAFEAMGCGLPIVATRVGGIPEVVDNPSLGELVERDDQQGMAESITRVLSTNMSRERIVQHAGQFSWENTVTAYLEVLESALKQ